MRYAELFAGAGGMSLGLERAGMTPAWHAEWSDFPRRVLQHHWPDVPLYGDVSGLGGAALTTLHGAFDLLSGGSPCQDLSVAGKRAGLTEGTRSSLFFQQMRLWEETGADLCLWENVAGALSSNSGKDFALVLSAFVGGAVPVPADAWRGAGVVCGPTGIAAWRIFDAQYFGVPQRRRRVFVLGTRSGRVDPAEILSLGEGVRRDTTTRRDARQGAPAAAGSGTPSESGVITIKGAAIGRQSQHGPQYGEVRDDGLCYTLNCPEQHAVLAFDSLNQTASRGACGTRRGEEGMTGAGWSGVFSVAENQRGEIRESDGITSLSAGGGKPGSGYAAVLAYAFGSHAGSNGDATNKAHGAGGPVGFGLTEEITPALRAGRTQAVCVTGSRTHALTHDGHDASEDGTVRGTPIVARCDTSGEGQRNDWETCTIPICAGVPRRLTPKECERLMGWPDDWTNILGASDSARYKACGNGVASPVAEWIGRRIMAAVEAVECAA
ncbi:MAG: DNA (cytosine-5-)-methyltransferase [Gemmatimonadaceae bacterium]